jgi:DegV family protein with EDD domain
MPRPTVLVVDSQAERRKDLSRGLTSLGYEVIPALDEQQGRRFAEELGPSVVVAPLSFLAGDSRDVPGSGDSRDSRDANIDGGGRVSGAAAPVSGPGRTLLLLGESEEQGNDLPVDVSYLATGGLDAAELVRRVHVLLLGREVGIEADSRLESLIGDLSLVPFLDLLRSLHRAEVSGRVTHPAGEVTLVGGQVVAASAGAALGAKAFCRLSHLGWGPIRVEPALADDESALGRAGGERQIETDTKSLIILALEDRVHDAPDRRTKIRLEMGRGFFDRTFTASQKEILAAISLAPTVGQLLDRLPATDGEILRALEELVSAGVVALEADAVAVQVVTDSTSDLTPELARAHGIRVVPLLVIFGDRIFHDGVDLGAREFYEKLEAGAASPRTNPPPRADFLKAYRELPAGRDILSLHVSEKLSQTLVNARAVAGEAGPSLAAERPAGAAAPELAVVDSVSISLGLGLQALFAARMARRGLDLGAIVRRLEVMRDRLHVLFVVDTLDYLARGGRIGKTRAAVGTLLGVKPILGIVGGDVVSVDRVRGGRAAHPRLADLFAQRVDPRRPVVVAIGHAKAPIWADRLRGLLQERFVVAELLVTEIGPVVGAHTGPGAVGAALFQPSDEEMALVAPL